MPHSFLQCFDTVSLIIWPVKIIPKMTYNVLSGMLSLYTTTTTLLEGAHPGGYDTQIRTRPIFLYNAPTPKFHHPVFTRSEFIVHTHTQTHLQTNKQMPVKTSKALCYVTKS